jgi:hypothetical protein
MGKSGHLMNPCETKTRGLSIMNALLNEAVWRGGQIKGHELEQIVSKNNAR